MGFFSKVQQLKEQYRQNAATRAKTQHLKNKLQLDELRQQKTVLAERSAVKNQLAQEREAVNKLKHPFVSNFKQKLKEGAAQHLAQSKTRNAQLFTGAPQFATGASPLTQHNSSTPLHSVMYPKEATPKKVRQTVIIIKK